MQLNKILILMLVCLLVLPMVFGLETLKPAKLNQEYIIVQTCATCSYVNISVSNQEGFLFVNQEMTLNGSGIWTYNYTPTNIGRYDVTGIGDLDGDATSFATYFDVTPSGYVGTLGFYFLILILSGGIIILGLWKQDAPIVILGSFGLYFVGLFILFNGIVEIKDTVYTWAIGLIVLMLASYISLKSAYELITN